MPDASSKLPFGATPGKIALVAVLGIVLVAVLVVQYGGVFWSSPGPADSAAAPASAKPVVRHVEPAAAGSAAAADYKPQPWPEFKLQEVLAHDPFAVPSGLAELLPPPPQSTPTAAPIDAQREAQRQREERRREMLASLRGLGVSMILEHQGELIAAIGERTLHVGDSIGEFRVVDINLREGVVLEAIDE